MSPEAAQACAMGWFAFVVMATYAVIMVWNAPWSFLHRFFIVILTAALAGILVSMATEWFMLGIGGQ